MECVTHKSEIENTFSSVRTFSFNEKKNPLVDEDSINHFLDVINSFTDSLRKKTKRIYDLNGRVEKLTWFTDLDEECLMLTNDLISSAKDLHSSLIRQYVSMNFLRSKGIAKDEIKDFKNAVDEVNEIAEDLESIFFFLPEFPDFVETTKQLSLV